MGELDFWIFICAPKHAKLAELFNSYYQWFQPDRKHWCGVYAELRTTIQVHVKQSKKFCFPNSENSQSKHLLTLNEYVWSENWPISGICGFDFVSFFPFWTLNWMTSFSDWIKMQTEFGFILELLIVANFRLVAARVSNRMSMPLTGRQANRHAHRGIAHAEPFRSVAMCVCACASEFAVSLCMYTCLCCCFFFTAAVVACWCCFHCFGVSVCLCYPYGCVRARLCAYGFFLGK